LFSELGTPQVRNVQAALADVQARMS